MFAESALNTPRGREPGRVRIGEWRAPEFVCGPETAVAFLSTGKGPNALAAQERAVELAEKRGVALFPLEESAEGVWSGRYDLVIAGSDEPWSLRELLFGNTERRLVRECPSPVWIIRHRPFPPSGGIVVAIDPDPIDRSRTLLAARTLQAALAIAELDGAELHVVNVVSPAHEALAINAGFTVDDARDLDWQVRQQQRFTVRRFLDMLNPGRQRPRLHLLVGNPVRQIANMVRRLDADLLVIGSAGRRGLSRLLIGNTAESAMREISSSYLVVKAA